MEEIKVKKRNKIDFGKEVTPSIVENETAKEMYEYCLEFLDKDYPGKILFTIKEVADILNLSEDFVSARIQNKKVQSTRFGNRYMINRLVLAELITKGVK